MHGNPNPRCFNPSTPFTGDASGTAGHGSGAAQHRPGLREVETNSCLASTRPGGLRPSTGCGCVAMHTLGMSRRCKASCNPDTCMRRPRTLAALAALAPKPHAVLGQEVLTDALWTVSYVSDGTERYIQAVLASRPIRRLQLESHVTLEAPDFPMLRFLTSLLCAGGIPYITRCHNQTLETRH